MAAVATVVLRSTAVRATSEAASAVAATAATAEVVATVGAAGTAVATEADVAACARPLAAERHLPSQLSALAPRHLP
eukprot:CAMPEP_0174839470 /NCGR_PEP_ID=MMETSP1114-20130205/8064_1 /TAXON_ID=312471 /ORGANISM="Neobodo designis, Strain CCAP 1951/1" /LENGTH=76 /DNA_ID=CAMNT_0016073591 /DNA_START=47 /DNA_END=273 /DNA_ORIENTATION=-